MPGLLRLCTAGTVDDGKSTLIGRLLYECKAVYDDQVQAVEVASRSRNVGPIDFSLFTDGLRAEREQGITIDVAYRYFSTPRRSFILADTPGHEQYTRNMATGASTADVAILLIDARHGVRSQTRRHARIARLLGISTFALAVNKMDLVDFRRDVFERIQAEFTQLVPDADAHAIPVSALYGDNVTTRSASTPWFHEATLLEFLETVEISNGAVQRPFRFPVQLVIRVGASEDRVSKPHPRVAADGAPRPPRRRVPRPSAFRAEDGWGWPRTGPAREVLKPHDFRGYAGQIVSGVVHPGDVVTVWPSRQRTRVKRIVTWDGDLEEAGAPMSVTLVLDEELDIGRGDVMATEGIECGTRFDAHVVWMDERPLDPDRLYLLKHGARAVPAEVNRGLALNDIGVVSVTTSLPLAFDRYENDRATGSFILIDPATNATAGAGMILGPGPDQVDATSRRPAAERLAHIARTAASDRDAIDAVQRVLEEILR